MCLGLPFRSAVLFHCSVSCTYLTWMLITQAPPVFGIARTSWLVLFLHVASSSRDIPRHSMTTKVRLFIVRVGFEVPPHLSLDDYVLFVPCTHLLWYRPCYLFSLGSCSCN